MQKSTGHSARYFFVAVPTENPGKPADSTFIRRSCVRKCLDGSSKKRQNARVVGRKTKRSGRRGRRPLRINLNHSPHGMVLYLLFLFISFPSTRPPSVPFAFSCWRRGTAERWMRSNALSYSKTSTEEKNASSVSFGCHLLPPEKAYFVPRLFLPSPVEKGDREAVDEECITAPSHLSSTHLHRLSFAFSCRRRGTAPRWMRSASPLPPTFRQHINFRSFSPSPAGSEAARGD